MLTKHKTIVSLALLGIAVSAVIGYRVVTQETATEPRRQTRTGAPARIDDDDMAQDYPTMPTDATGQDGGIQPPQAQSNSLPQMTSYRYVKEAVFPDGRSLEIQFDNTPATDPQQATDASQVQSLSALSELAMSGNHVAARRLYEEVENCTRFPRTEAELETFLQRPVPGSMSNEQITSLFERCREVSDETVDTARELLKESADAGHIPSVVTYAHAVYDSDPDISASYFHIAWAEGYVSGADGLAQYYAARDSVTSHAYLYAARTIELANMSGVPGFDEWIADTEEELSSTALTIPETEEAWDRAYELINSNVNCCRF